MSEYPLFVGAIDYGATGEGTTYIVFASRAQDEDGFRKQFGDRLNKHYCAVGKEVAAYDVAKQPPPYDPENPVQYTWEETQKRYPDAATWFMTGAEVFKGLPEKHYVVDHLLSTKVREALQQQVDADAGKHRWSGHVDIFLVSYLNFS